MEKKTFAQVEASIEHAGIDYSLRTAEEISACGCAVTVDPYGHVQIRPVAVDADPHQVRQALN